MKEEYEGGCSMEWVNCVLCKREKKRDRRNSTTGVATKQVFFLFGGCYLIPHSVAGLANKCMLPTIIITNDETLIGFVTKISLDTVISNKLQDDER